jgi:hypothetical protein
METIKEALTNCNDISSNIMDKVCDALSSEGISYKKTTNSEIVITNKTKKEVNECVVKNSGVSCQQLKLLLQISEGTDKVFIRQKFN